MGIFYSVEVILDLKYEKKNIQYFFQECLENNIRLYSVSFCKLIELSSSNAADRMLSLEIKSEERYVHAKFQDTDFSILIFREKNNLLSFSISGFGITWKKEFMDGSYRIDFARYIRLLLRVCKDFTILSLETGAF